MENPSLNNLTRYVMRARTFKIDVRIERVLRRVYGKMFGSKNI